MGRCLTGDVSRTHVEITITFQKRTCQTVKDPAVRCLLRYRTSWGKRLEGNNKIVIDNPIPRPKLLQVKPQLNCMIRLLAMTRVVNRGFASWARICEGMPVEPFAGKSLHVSLGRFFSRALAGPVAASAAVFQLSCSHLAST